MKSKTLAFLPIFVALVAVLALPFNAVAAAVAVVGILAILSSDYRRGASPLRAHARIISITTNLRPEDGMREAA